MFRPTISVVDLTSGRVLPVEESYQWKSLTSGRVLPVEESYQWKSLTSGRVLPVEESYQWKSLTSGRVIDRASNTLTLDVRDDFDRNACVASVDEPSDRVLPHDRAAR